MGFGLYSCTLHGSHPEMLGICADQRVRFASAVALFSVSSVALLYPYSQSCIVCRYQKDCPSQNVICTGSRISLGLLHRQNAQHRVINCVYVRNQTPFWFCTRSTARNCRKLITLELQATNQTSEKKILQRMFGPINLIKPSGNFTYHQV
jgi:hypothetical protein